MISETDTASVGVFLGVSTKSRTRNTHSRTFQPKLAKVQYRIKRLINAKTKEGQKILGCQIQDQTVISLSGQRFCRLSDELHCWIFSGDTILLLNAYSHRS